MQIIDPFYFREVTVENWPDLERLFEAPGGPKFCWCMVWRASPEENRQTNSACRKTALKRRVEEGIPIGILAYQEEEPVAWCSIAPKSTYRRLTKNEESTGENNWSLVCFFVPKKWRGAGLMRQLIDAAIDQARKNGATAIEAYPVDADSPSYRFMGYVQAFQSAGFEEVGREGSRRHVVRLLI